MWIFIRQVTKGTTREELSKFVTKGLRPSWLIIPIRSHTKVKRCEILQIFNPDTKNTEYHGLVLVDPSKAALPIINRLNGRELKGKLVEVHKYFRRSPYRDRRRTLYESNERQEFRRQDRRRDRLISRVVHAPEIQRTLGIL